MSTPDVNANAPEPSLNARKKSAGQGGAIMGVVPANLASGGVPMGERAQSFAQSIFGRRFDEVRIHSDARASEHARALDADAFAVQNHIYFDAGKYAPETKVGQALLAHELTHVAQGGGKPQARLASGGGAEHAAEAQAGAVERAVRDGTRVPSIGRLTGQPSILRKAKKVSGREDPQGRGNLILQPGEPINISAGHRAEVKDNEGMGSVSPTRPPAEIARNFDIVGFTEVAYGVITKRWGDESGPDGAYTLTTHKHSGSGESYDVIRVWGLRKRTTSFRFRPSSWFPALKNPLALTVLADGPRQPSQVKADDVPTLQSLAQHVPVQKLPILGKRVLPHQVAIQQQHVAPRLVVPNRPAPRPVAPPHQIIAGPKLPKTAVAKSAQPVLAREVERSRRQGKRHVKPITSIFEDILTERVTELMSVGESPEAAPLPEFAIEHQAHPTGGAKGNGGGFGGILSALKAGLAFAGKLLGFVGGAIVSAGKAVWNAGVGLASAIGGAIEGFKSGGIKGAAAQGGGVGKAAEGMQGAVKSAVASSGGLKDLVGGLFKSTLPGGKQISQDTNLERAAVANQRAVERDFVGGAPRGSMLAPASGGGENLTGPAREYAESFLGRSVADVRIFRDAPAAAAADALQAHAFASGNAVYFGRGEFQPHTPKGMALLVHELTHVQQQAGLARFVLPGLVRPALIRPAPAKPPVAAGIGADQLVADLSPLVFERRQAAKATVLPGLPIAQDLRREIEDAIDVDLAKVRLFTGSSASAAAKNLDADAFATGESIVLGERAAADLAAGKTGTIAHEIEHIRQFQRGETQGAKTPLARDLLEQSAKAVEAKIPVFSKIAGLSDFLNSPALIDRVAGGLPDEFALLSKPAKKPEAMKKPEEKDQKEPEEEDDGTHVIHWAMWHYGVRPSVGEEEFLDEVAERVRDLMEEELKIERERKHVEAPF